MKLIFVLFSATALAAPSINLLTARQSSRVEFTDNISFQGIGCPKGFTSFDKDNDGRALNFAFSGFQVLVGNNVDNPQNPQEDCELLIGLQYPVGCTSTMIETSYHGVSQVDDGVTGSATSRYSISKGSVNPTTGGSDVFPASFGDNEWRSGDNVTTNIGGAGQQDVTFTIRAGLTMSTPSDALVGSANIDSLIIHIRDTC